MRAVTLFRNFEHCETSSAPGISSSNHGNSVIIQYKRPTRHSSSSTNSHNFGNWVQTELLGIPELEAVPRIPESEGIPGNSRKFGAIPSPLNSRNSVSELLTYRRDEFSATTVYVRVRTRSNSGTEFQNWKQFREFWNREEFRAIPELELFPEFRVIPFLV